MKVMIGSSIIDCFYGTKMCKRILLTKFSILTPFTIYEKIISDVKQNML